MQSWCSLTKRLLQKRGRTRPPFKERAAFALNGVPVPALVQREVQSSLQVIQTRIFSAGIALAWGIGILCWFFKFRSHKHTTVPILKDGTSSRLSSGTQKQRCCTEAKKKKKVFQHPLQNKHTKLNICSINTSPWTRHSCLAPELTISEPGWDRWLTLSHYINYFPTRQACQIFTASYVENRYTHTYTLQDKRNKKHPVASLQAFPL